MGGFTGGFVVGLAAALGERLEPVGDFGDDGRVEKHADLDGVDGDVIGHGVELGAQEFGRGHVDVADAHGVLADEGGDDAHAVGAVGGEGLQVGLQAGAAAGVGAGDRQHAGDAAGDGGAAGDAAAVPVVGELPVCGCACVAHCNILSPVLAGSSSAGVFSARSVAGTPCRASR